MLKPYLKLIAAPLLLPNGVIIRLLRDRKFGNGFMSFQRSLVPIDSFNGELLEKHEVSEHWTKKIPLSEIENIYQKLEGVKIPILPKCGMPEHGITYSLTIGNSTNSIIYRWRIELPEGWEAIGEVANTLLGMANQPEIDASSRITIQ